MKSSSPQRVAVVGGGIFGVSTALHLARGGAEAWLITEGAFADALQADRCPGSILPACGARITISFA